MVCTVQEAKRSLQEFPRAIAALDVTAHGQADLEATLAQVRIAQRTLDGLVMRIGARIEHLAQRGRSAPPEEAMRGAGTVGGRTARRDAARARAAADVPGLEEAVSRGAVSGEHVDAIARHSAKLSDEQRAGFDFNALVQPATTLPPETFDRLVRRKVQEAQADHGLADTTAKQRASEFRHWFDAESGMGRFSGALDPERYEALTDALDQHMASLAATSDTPLTKTKNLAAQALVELILWPATARSGRARLPSVTVVVDYETVVNGPHPDSVRQTAAGHDLAPESVARLCCDAVIRKVVLDQQGVPISVGRKYRSATDAQWAAIKAVHATCAWDGCQAPIGWCQAHHIREWEHGGATDLDNLVPLCSRHHHRVHEGQWHIKLLPDRSLRIFKPDGSHYTTVASPKRC